ncbi:hypothetical protein D3C87_2167530 [compost metagenome]
MIRRAIEAGASPNVTIEIDAGNLPDEMKVHFSSRIAETLSRRIVSIEPAGVATTIQIETR